MITLTQDAQRDLDRYLKHLNAALRGHSSIDAEDVERDVVGHIDAELAAEVEPIDAPRLRHILERLGPPDAWVPAEDLPAWRRLLERMRSGPQEWRLAYLTLVLFLGGMALFASRPILWPLPLLLLLASFLTARASLSLLAEHDEAPGARRWFLYPPLIPAAAFMGAVLFTWPLFPVVALSEDGHARERVLGLVRGNAGIVVPCAVLFAIGAWWIVLGLLLKRFPGALHFVMRPFGDWFGRRHAMRLTIVGVLLAVAAAAVAALATF